MLPVVHKSLGDIAQSVYFTFLTEKAAHLQIDTPVQNVATTMNIINEVDSETSTLSWIQGGRPKVLPLDPVKGNLQCTEGPLGS